ncbi:hypothetical protein [Halorussus caseinilyticus]|uniref:Uncharacterized protein n=1 Tax=Halorussus caseinilyticus TaxID=3034025 RepID=A0ABD5WI95_9EURY
MSSRKKCINILVKGPIAIVSLLAEFPEVVQKAAVFARCISFTDDLGPKQRENTAMCAGSYPRSYKAACAA